MSTSTEIAGSFADEEQCVRAIEALREAKFASFKVFAPFPIEKILHAIGRPKSWVRLFVLIGGITGVLTGIAVTVGTSLEWNLVAGGKPIVSVPPFIIICFELMILLGGLSGLAGFFFLAGVPVFEPVTGYRSRFGEDRFGVVVRCADAECEQVESILKEAGAEDVSVPADRNANVAVDEHGHTIG